MTAPRCPKCGCTAVSTVHIVLRGYEYKKHACSECGQAWRCSRHDGLDLELLPTPAGAP